MKLLSIAVLTLFIAAFTSGCDDRSDSTEIAFTETLDIFDLSSPSLPSSFEGRPITGFVVGYSLENTEAITIYTGDIPRATLEGAGAEVGPCNDGRRFHVALDPSPDRPLRMTAQIIGDTGAEDVSTDRNCRCDSRIDQRSG